MTNYNNFNQSFIRCSAPALCGIKPANLFTLSLSEYEAEAFFEWKSLLQKQNLEVISFKSSKERMMIISYDLVWIRKIFSDAVIQAYLRGKGYSNPLDTTKTLKDLFSKIQKQENFPHEVGLILGYPFEDVVGFEKNDGRHCKYCGYWKSYCNPEEAKRCCTQYKQCSQMCKQWFEEGLSVPQIIKKYKEVAQNAA